MTDQAELFYRRSDRALFTTVNREVVALDVEGGQCFGLNGVASAVWEVLDEPRSLSQICELLTPRFEVGETECRSDVGELLDDLVRDGIVEVSTRQS